MNLILAGVLGYVLLQLAIGVAVSRRIRTETDYLLAGRSLGYTLATFSIFATWFGAETCIGSAGVIFEEGLSGASHDPFGYTLCLLVMGLLLAGRLWQRRLTTLGDLFRERYSTSVERFAVLVMVPTSLFWAAAQIRAFGQVLAAASPLELQTTVTIAAAVVIVYTVAGGLLADAWTDLVQGGVMAVGLVAVLFAALVHLGGPAEAWNAIDPRRLAIFPADTSWLARLDDWAVPICGSLVAQELIARVLASRSRRVAVRSCLAATGVYLSIGLIPVFIGLVGARLVFGLDDPEHLLPTVAQRFLPLWLYIIFVGALVSAILSTVDSTLLASAGLASENLFASFKPSLGPVARLRISRACVVAFGLIAYAVALGSDGIYALVESASAFGSAGLVVIMLFGLFGRFGGRWAALAALLAGVGVSIYSEFLHELSVPYLKSLAAALGMFVFVGGLEWAAARVVQPAGGSQGVAAEATDDSPVGTGVSPIELHRAATVRERAKAAALPAPTRRPADT